MNNEQIQTLCNDIATTLLIMYDILVDMLQNNNITDEVAMTLLDYINEILMDELILPDTINMSESKYRWYTGFVFVSDNMDSLMDTLVNPSDWLHTDKIRTAIKTGTLGIAGSKECADDDVISDFMSNSDIFCTGEFGKVNSSNLPIVSVWILSVYHLCVRLICLSYSCLNYDKLDGLDHIDKIRHKVAISLNVQKFSKAFEHKILNDNYKFDWGIRDICDGNTNVLFCTELIGVSKVM